MSVKRIYSSDYVSPILTPQTRQWAEEKATNSHRTDWYDLTPEECETINEYTRENFSIDLITLDWATVVERLGLALAEPVVTFEEDEEGQVLYDEHGEPKVLERKFPDVKFKCEVKAEGLMDCNGKAVPKGKGTRFTFSRQSTNRPLNESNWRNNVLPRIPKWMLNGETMIKDSNGVGISEQHTLTARAVQILQGDVAPDDEGMIKFAVNDVHPLASITADTGKANTGGDIFGSDPEIIPVDILETTQSYLGEARDDDGEVIKVLVPDQVTTRTKACNVTQSASKLTLLRLAGKDVNASLGNSQQATERAHIFTTRICPDFDDLCAMCYTFIQSMPFKSRPVSEADLSAALALWLMREHEAIDSIDRKTPDAGVSFEECPVIRFDLESVKPFLNDLANSDNGGRIGVWTANRLHAGRKKDKKHQKFAQLVRMITAYFADEEIDAHHLKASECGTSTAKKYLHFGGADRGPIKKAEKTEEEPVGV